MFIVYTDHPEAYRGLKNWLGLKFDYKQSEKKRINIESAKGH